MLQPIQEWCTRAQAKLALTSLLDRLSPVNAVTNLFHSQNEPSRSVF